MDTIHQDYQAKEPRKILNRIIAAENPYQQENLLRDLLRWQAISGLDDSLHISVAMQHEIDSLAALVDKKTENDYWTAQAAAVAQWDSAQCYAWLQAEAARSLCRAGVLNSPRGVEIWAGLGFMALQIAPDLRTAIEIKQRIFVNLYKNYSLYQLAAVYAGRVALEAGRIKDHLRHIGVRFQHGEIYREAGSFETRRKALLRTDRFSKQVSSLNVPFLDYYSVFNLIRLAEAFTQSGDNDQAWSICDSVLTLPATQRFSALRDQLRIVIGLIHLNRSEFDDALSMNKMVVETAANDLDRLLALRNIVTVYERLSNPHKAREALDQADALLEKNRISDPRLELLFLTRRLRVDGARNTESHNNLLIQAIERHIAKLEISQETGEAWGFLGLFFMRVKDDPRTALNYFRKAAAVFSELGMTAAVAIPNSLAARMTRIAISPRLAINRRLKA